MKHILFILLGFSTIAFAQSEDSWHIDTYPARYEPFFWDFKYFSFYSPDLVGNITYFGVAAQLTRKVTVTGHFYGRDKTWIFTKDYDLSCIYRDNASASLDVCSSGGINVVDPRNYGVSLQNDKAEWNIAVSAQDAFTGATQHTFLEGDALFGIVFPFEMFWRPVFPLATASGSVTFKNNSQPRIFALNNVKAYHDENWGKWNPANQPYHWMSFASVDSKGQPLEVLLGEFYKNTKQPPGGIVVRHAGRSQFYPKGEYEFKIAQWGLSKVNRVGAAIGMQDSFIEQPVTGFSEGSHPIPIEYSITSNDGRVKLAAHVWRNDSTGPAIPALVQKFSDFIIDEQVVQVDLDLISDDGEHIVVNGMGGVQHLGDQ